MRGWTRDDLLAAMRSTRCPCRACVQHGQVHPHTEVDVWGVRAGIETALVPLIESLVGAGIVPVASCSDLTAVIEAVDPREASRIVAQVGAPGLHYGRVVAERLAYVRFGLLDAAAVELALAARGLPGVRVRSGVHSGFPVAQVEFPRRAASHLEALCA